MVTEPMRVLVTNAEERILAACRCLHAAGYEVGVVAFRPLAPTHASRGCDERLRMTDPLQDGERFVEDLRRQLTSRQYAVLLPGRDRALLAISHGRERLEGLARIGLPAPASVERSLDREVMAEVARPRRRVAHAYFQITDPLPLLLRGLGMALSQAERGTPTIDPGTPPPKGNDEPVPT
jgi:hypothetical protein